jgi:hypothetical protein
VEIVALWGLMNWLRNFADSASVNRRVGRRDVEIW